MIRSLYSGVSGMKNHQVRMDIVGNNIANVNTTAYKASRANFQDTLYQTIKSAGENTNPAQAGLGIGLAGITSKMTSGGLTSTGRTLDLAINGSGFFKVTHGVNEYYTRDGIFSLTQKGDLVNLDGFNVIGEVWDKASIEGTDNENALAGIDGVLEIQGTLSEGNLGEKIKINVDGSTTLEQVKDKINEKSSVSGVTASINDEGKIVLSTLYPGHSEASTLFVTETAVSKALELTKDGDAPKIADNPLTNPTDFATKASSITLNGVEILLTNVKGLGDGIDAVTNENAVVTALQADIDAVYDGTSYNGVTFKVDVDGSHNIRITSSYTGSDGIDLSGSDANSASILGFTDLDAVIPSYNDAKPSDRIEDKAIIFSSVPIATLQILNNGIISATDTNGEPVLFKTKQDDDEYDVARITLNNFKNQDGLERSNKNMFKSTASSGEPTPGTPGSPGYGTVESGYIEMSNVDLTEQFTDMITTQRGYQAGARIITVSDTMLEELINLKR